MFSTLIRSFFFRLPLSFWVMVTLWGIFLSKLTPLVMSVGMIGIMVSAVFADKGFSSLRQFREERGLFLFVLFFLAVAASGLYSENLDYWLERTRIKLPFLLLPIAFFLHPPPGKNAVFKVLHALFFTSLIVSLVVLGIFLTDASHVIASYSFGKGMATPFSHIRFSLMVAFSVGVGLYLFLEGYARWHKAERWIIAGGVVFLVIFLHLLAVRSGLVALYLSLLSAGVVFFIKNKNRKLLLASIVLVVSLPLASWALFPTFQNKVAYMKFDLEMFFSGNLEHYSDARRLRSMQAGWETGKANLLAGCGYGDIADEVNRFYETKFPELSRENYLLPHNQFLFVFAGIGLSGLFIFLAMIFLPLIQGFLSLNLPLIFINLVALSSFFTEHTLESQVGTAFYLVPLLFLYRSNQSLKKDG